MNWFKQSQHDGGLRVWLDDERDPTDPQVQRDFGAHGDEIWVKTAPEAIKMLEQGRCLH